jgi:hypothetical protein
MDVQKMMDVQAARDRYKHFKCAIDGKPLDVYEFTAEESILANFRVVVTVVSAWEPDVTDYLGKNAVLTLTGKKRQWTIVFSRGRSPRLKGARKKAGYIFLKSHFHPVCGLSP